MSINRVWTAHGSGLVRRRNGRSIPLVSPRVEAAIGTLRSVLPFPFVRQPFARPSGIGSRIFERNPGYGPIVPASRILPILPVAQEIQIIRGVIVSDIEKLLEFRIGHGKFVDIEGGNVHSVFVKSPGSVFPRILHIDTNIVETLDLNPPHLEKEIAFRNLDHASERAAGGFAFAIGTIS